MHKFLILFIILASVAVHAGNVSNIENSTINNPVKRLDYSLIDSLTYQYYWLGKWDDLINIGKEALNQQIDFKRLRQRMGYAFFLKGNYYEAMKQYEEAFAFDKSDMDIQLYLYYCGLYTGHESYSRFQAGKLPEETQKYLALKPFRLIDALDFEYNYKFNDSKLATNNNFTRSNPNYFRIGCSTKLSYQLSLYQAFSKYEQKLDSIGNPPFNLAKKSYITQNEYYAGLNWKPLNHFEFMFAYHFINTIINDSTSWQVPPIIKIYYNGTATSIISNMLFSKITFNYNRFEVSLSGSLLNCGKELTQQYTLQAGVTLPGTLGIKTNSKVDAIFDNTSKRLIYSQSVGLMPIKSVWIEGNISFGNLKNYSDNDGLYILNSTDPTIFKTGATTFWHISKNLCLFGNYIFEIKHINNTNNLIINYNQHSLSGGIIWKL